MPKNSTTRAVIVPAPAPFIERRIYLIRGLKAMLDSDLAKIYQVPTKVLNQAVRRNLRRFPEDFMFQLSQEDLANWRSQIVTSNPAAKMGLRRPPLAFTELGVAMLSSVLNSERALQMNILIMRAFVKLRELLSTNKDLAARIEKLETRQKEHGQVFSVVIKDIENLAKNVNKEFKKLKNPHQQKPRIGFVIDQN
jgi:Zn-dependent M16 (insulinase) family peptidase